MALTDKGKREEEEVMGLGGVTAEGVGGRERRGGGQGWGGRVTRPSHY